MRVSESASWRWRVDHPLSSPFLDKMVYGVQSPESCSVCWRHEGRRETCLYIFIRGKMTSPATDRDHSAVCNWLLSLRERTSLQKEQNVVMVRVWFQGWTLSLHQVEVDRRSKGGVSQAASATLCIE